MTGHRRAYNHQFDCGGSDLRVVIDFIGCMILIKIGAFRENDEDLNFLNVGICKSSNVCALCFCRIQPFRLIGFGLAVWVFATAGCGFSVGFWSILTFRM